MKAVSSLSSLFLLGAISNVAAFPAGDFANVEFLNKRVPLDKLGEGAGALDERGLLDFATLLAKAKTLSLKNATVFNAEDQLIDVTGDHAWQMPDLEGGDVRGPCPPLNALANHGYLPRNGVGSILEYMTAANFLGMGWDTALVLGVYGTVLGGNPVSLTPGVSMGGESNATEAQNILGNLGGLLGKPQGITGTHNIFEGDSSITRGDKYSGIGNNNDVHMPYFMELYNTQKDAEDPHYTVDIFLDHRVKRINESIATNPYFYYGPWIGWFVVTSAYLFASNIVGNSSVEYPNGHLDKETLKSFWGVWGPEDNMTYIAGSEKIPDNYYRPASDYGAAQLWVDHVEKVILQRPEIFFTIGGNVNGTNTFAGLNLEDLSGGIANTKYFLEGNNLLCFVFQILEEGAPNVIGSLYATAEPVLGFLLDAINLPLTSLNCGGNKAWEAISGNGHNLFDIIKSTYPGAAKSGVFL